jgi:hypothetical protein
MKSPVVAHHKHLWSIAIFLLFFTQPGCRKTDILTSEMNNQAESFFHAHPSNHPIVQKIAVYFSKKNEVTGIASTIANTYGIPYWDKTLLFEESGTARSTTDASVIVAYIPLLQNNETSVQAQLTVRLNTADTSFEILTAGQYAQFGFMPNDTTALNGLKVFTLFAGHDRNIFGYTKFNIADNRILLGQNTFPVDMNRHYQVTLLSLPLATSGRVLAVPAPLPHSSCLVVKDYEAAGYTVTYTQIGQVCVVSSYGLNDGFGGDTGSGGSGSGGTGGGGTGGGGNPPGWVPIPEEGVFPRNPCEVVDSLLKTTGFMQHLINLRNATTLNYETGISFTLPDTAGSTHTNYTGQGLLAVTIAPTIPVDGIMHNHYNNPKRLSIFSADDIVALAYNLVHHEIRNTKTFTYTLVTDSTAYIIMIEDSTKFMNFVNIWFDTREHIHAFSRQLYTNYNVGYSGITNSDNEKNFIEGINAYPLGGCGLKIFRGNSSMTIFTPIILNSSNQVIPDPCL